MDEIVVGTYEGFLLGYSLSYEDERSKIKQTFATHSHTASVRCVSIAGKFLASGGTDDKVVVIDMKSRKEHTVLMNHDGTVNTCAFTHKGTHLLTGSDDGSIIVTRTGNWQIEKIWKKAHQGFPITDIAVHPSDKLALSIGGDKTLRTWNLVKGRPAFTINLSSKGVTLPTEIKFSPAGDRFSLIHEQNVDVWTISKAGIEKQIKCTTKPTSVQWVSDEQMYVGLDSGNIISFTVSDTQAQTYKAHKQRVKCLHYNNNILYSLSSSGEIKVWSESDSKLSELSSYNAACRVTCVTLNRQSHLIKKEEKSDEEQSEAEENIKETEEKDKSDVSDEDEPKAPSPPPKRKPGAFVTISYGNDDEEKEGGAPPKKKFKKKKRNKNKNKKNKVVE
ncbi:p21-activated protein kinase-interacting protein 1-like [Leguminivora glycinivorella]|uniref:p21-activated protein kinase-interacting protein 1-like n=1 Tax=Leguminivora glycinivorella TaxID=1035111 RepID=UPI00200F2466|nr:p21-activated protein kinase-interacting protein 1-like [Leguminivora glycinivorella]